jgi:hypothetical protein
MIRKDYLVRQLEEFGKVIARLRSLIAGQDRRKFEEELEEAFRTFTTLQVEKIEKLDIAGIKEQVINHESLSQDQKKMVADLLFEKLILLLGENDAENTGRLRENCLLLYRHLLDNYTQNEYNLDTHFKVRFLESF